VLLIGLQCPGWPVGSKLDDPQLQTLPLPFQ